MLVEKTLRKIIISFAISITVPKYHLALQFMVGASIGGEVSNMRMNVLSRVLVISFLVLLRGLVYGQQITKPNYIEYLPLAPLRIVSQTDASRILKLYDAPDGQSYVDSSAEDGIDDNRHQRLLLIAERFAPKLLWNTPYSIPLDFRSVINNQMTPLLHIDQWELSRDEPRLFDAFTVNMAIDDSSQCPGLRSETMKGVSWMIREGLTQWDEDCKLRGLVKRFNPLSASPHKLNPDADTLTVLYFDTPGEDEESWKRNYKAMISDKLQRRFAKYSKIYAHPFIHEELADKRFNERYEFVIQYWFFYPFNDGGNNHEGDWEHLNVRVTPKARRRGLLSEHDIREILDADNESKIQNLVIKKVDYYFHSRVMILDYTFPDVYLSPSAWDSTLKVLKKQKIGEDRKWQRTQQRANLGGSINTHPTAFIGGDNKGLDQVLHGPGGSNRDSHGTYPFVGLYKSIGPLDAAEEVKGDHRIAKELQDSSRYVTYFKDQIEIIPDWERLVPLVQNKPLARRRWSWLLLPIRWGFPASKSPGAGILNNADTGNLAPVGPAYNSGWNRVGDCKGYMLYEPHEFSAGLPVNWTDNFENDWGFLNLTLPTLVTYPPFDFLWRTGPLSSIRSFAGRKNPIFYPKENVPYRRVAVYVGFYPFLGDNDFALLISKAQQMEIKELLNYGHFESPILKHTGTFSFENVGIQINYYLGSSYTSENMFLFSSSDVSYTLRNSSSAEITRISGNLQMIEYAGSIRYDLSRKTFQPYFKIGYGYSSYRVRNLRINTGPDLGSTDWFHTRKFWPLWPPRNWLPNTGHVGIGFEWLVSKNYSESRFPFRIWKSQIGTPDIGVGLEYALFFHDLDRGSFGHPIRRHLINFKFSLSF